MVKMQIVLFAAQYALTPIAPPNLQFNFRRY